MTLRVICLPEDSPFGVRGRQRRQSLTGELHFEGMGLLKLPPGHYGKAAVEAACPSRSAMPPNHSVALFLLLPETFENLGRFDIQHRGDIHELQNVDAPLPIFVFGDEGLRFAKGGCDLGLGHTLPFACLDEQGQEHPLPGSTQRFLHLDQGSVEDREPF